VFTSIGDLGGACISLSLKEQEVCISVPVSRLFRMSLADGSVMFDAINYQVICNSNVKTNFIMSSRITFLFIEHKVGR
jgi:hypothetical protein